MKSYDVKYYRVKQIKKGVRVAGNLILIGRQYGYIVQLHYFDTPGYKENKTFDSFEQAEKYFDDVLSKEA
jgi:hypothetical protein